MEEGGGGSRGEWGENVGGRKTGETTSCPERCTRKEPLCPLRFDLMAQTPPNVRPHLVGGREVCMRPVHEVYASLHLLLEAPNAGDLWGPRGNVDVSVCDLRDVTEVPLPLLQPSDVLAVLSLTSIPCYSPLCSPAMLYVVRWQRPFRRLLLLPPNVRDRGIRARGSRSRAGQT